MTLYSIGLQMLVADCIAANGWASKYLADLLTLLSVHSDQVNCKSTQTCNDGLQRFEQIEL